MEYATLANCMHVTFNPVSYTLLNVCQWTSNEELKSLWHIETRKSLPIFDLQCSIAIVAVVKIVLYWKYIPTQFDILLIYANVTATGQNGCFLMHALILVGLLSFIQVVIVVNYISCTVLVIIQAQSRIDSDSDFTIRTIMTFENSLQAKSSFLTNFVRYLEAYIKW